LGFKKASHAPVVRGGNVAKKGANTDKIIKKSRIINPTNPILFGVKTFQKFLTLDL
jgi:hypothetical protein